MSKEKQIIERLERIEKLISSQSHGLKKVLNFNEACQYLELSKSYLYKLTSSRALPFYKPSGKKLYFKRKELDEWLLRNRSKSSHDLNQSADNYLIKNRKGGGHEKASNSFKKEWFRL